MLHCSTRARKPIGRSPGEREQAEAGGGKAEDLEERKTGKTRKTGETSKIGRLGKRGRRGRRGRLGDLGRLGDAGDAEDGDGKRGKWEMGKHTSREFSAAAAAATAIGIFDGDPFRVSQFSAFPGLPIFPVSPVSQSPASRWSSDSPRLPIFRVFHVSAVFPYSAAPQFAVNSSARVTHLVSSITKCRSQPGGELTATS